MKTFVLTVGAAGAAVAAVPLVARLRKDWQAFQVLRAIDIRTVNTVAADTERTRGK
jgi:hypothetical protein